MEAARGTGLLVHLSAAILACLLAGCGGAHARFTSHLHKGQEYLSSGNLEKAGVEFRNAAQIEPRNAEALFYNGRVAELRGNLRDAVGLYLAATDADPRFAPARASLGKLLVFGGAPQRALETVAPDLEKHPDDPDLLAVRAAARVQLKDETGALQDAERAHAVSPLNENALAILAAIYVQKGDRSRAVELISESLKKSPRSVDLRAVLANLYLSGGQPEQAEQQMKSIIALQPNDLAPRTQLALHLLRSHKTDEAQQVLEKAVEDFTRSKDVPKADAARLALVDFISTQRSREQGEKILREFIRHDPDNLDLRLGLGSLLQRSGAEAESITAYQQVIKADGTGPKALMARDRIAAIHFTRGRYEKARLLVNEVLQKNPRDNDALILRASLEMQQDDAAGAIADLRAVLRDQPNSLPLKRSLAAAYARKGEPALAEETLRSAMQSAPNDSSVRVDLARLLAATDRRPESITLLEETVKLLPNDPAPREQLILAYLSNGNLTGARSAAEYLQEHAPSSAAGFYYAGLIAEREKRWDESSRDLEKALSLQPHNLETLTALTRIDVERGAFESGVKRLRSALDQDPNNISLVNLLGGLYLNHKDLDRAQEMFTRAGQLDPRLWQPHRNLAAVRLAADDVEGALLEFHRAVTLAPGEPQLVTDAASAYEKYGKAEEAIACYETLYKTNPRAAQLAANNLAMLLVTYRKDAASLDRALELTRQFANSSNGSLLDTLGWVRFKRGEYRDALAALEQALARSPDAHVIRYHLAMTQLHLGLRDNARANLESALNGAQSFQGVEEARTALKSLKGTA